MLLKRFASFVTVRAVPPSPPVPPGAPSDDDAPVNPANPTIRLVSTPSPTWRVPLTTEMMELLLVLVIFPEKRTIEEPVGSKTSEPALVTFPRIDPPAPIASVPALIVVPPVKLLAPVSVNVPAPDFVRAPLPLITPERVVFPEPSSVRLYPALFRGPEMTRLPFAAVNEAVADWVNPSATVWVVTELLTMPAAPIVTLLPVRVLVPAPALKVIPVRAVTHASFVTVAVKPGLLKVRFESLVIPIVLRFPDPLVQRLVDCAPASTADPTNALTTISICGATLTRCLRDRRKRRSSPNGKNAGAELEWERMGCVMARWVGATSRKGSWMMLE